jgi:5-carboxymethyl-2-hydroxymuconate isomerase
MAHLIVEYSSNLEQVIDIEELLKCLHQSALSTGIFPPGGMRTRAAPRPYYVIADGDPDNMFLHLTAKVGSGRPEEVRQQACDTIFKDTCDFMDEIFNHHPIGISFEMQEIHSTLTYKKNNLHEKLKAKEASK